MVKKSMLISLIIKCQVSDYGRGIPLGKLIDVVSKMNTGAKYDSKVFKKSVGLNGVGIKAVNAFSHNFLLNLSAKANERNSFFKRQKLLNDLRIRPRLNEPNGH